MEGADHPREEEVGHLEVRFNLFLNLSLITKTKNYFSSTSAVEVITMVVLVLVASFTWFNGLSKSIYEFAEEN